MAGLKKLRRSKPVKRGPGRPREGRVPFLIHMLPEKMDRLRKIAFDVPTGKFIESLFE